MAAFQSFEEVWAALGRLYDDIVKLQESQQQTAAHLAKVTTELDRVTERIDRLAEGGWIAPLAAQDLTRAYRFLRRVENRLQMIGDQQTHVLPEEPEGHERVTSMLATLAGTVTQLASLVDSHERRLARMEGQ